MTRSIQHIDDVTRKVTFLLFAHPFCLSSSSVTAFLVTLLSESSIRQEYIIECSGGEADTK